MAANVAFDASFDPDSAGFVDEPADTTYLPVDFDPDSAGFVDDNRNVTLTQDVGTDLKVGSAAAVEGLADLSSAGAKAIPRYVNAGPLAAIKLAQPIYEGIKDFFGDKKDEYSQEYSPEHREAMAKPMVVENPDSPTGYSPGEGLKEPRKYISALAQSAPATLLGIGFGALGTKAIQAGRVIGPKLAGAIGFGGGEAVVSAGMSGVEVADKINQMPFEDMAESPLFAAKLQEGKDPWQARQEVADEAASRARLTAGTATFILGAPSGALFGKIMGGENIAPTRLGALGLGALGEGFQEFTQSGAEKIAQNEAVRLANPSQSLSEGVAESAVGGALSGALMGGGLAGISHSNKPTPPSREIRGEPAPGSNALEPNAKPTNGMEPIDEKLFRESPETTALGSVSTIQEPAPQPKESRSANVLIKRIQENEAYRQRDKANRPPVIDRYPPVQSEPIRKPNEGYVDFRFVRAWTNNQRRLSWHFVKHKLNRIATS